MRSPLTGIVFALELTHNMGGLLPVTVGCIFAHATTVLLLRRSILTEKVARHGHHVTREYAIDPFEATPVSDIMATPAETLPADMPIADVIAFFSAPATPRRHKSYPVVDESGTLAGMVSRSDVLRWTIEGWPAGQCLRDVVAEQDLTVGYEDELAGHVADRMALANAGRVPILRRSDQALVGLVARRDLLRIRSHQRRHENEREALLGFRMAKS
jgi:chloride channel protein, CIC family